MAYQALVLLLWTNIFIGSEAQTRDCYAESSCSGVVQQMNSNFQQCCLETSIGLAVRIDEQCEPCLVLGFTQDTLVATERSQAYQVSIDVSKGFTVHGIKLRQLVYQINVAPDSTAVSGVDYIYNTTTIALTSVGPYQVEFTIPEDDLSLEPNKTLRLKMELVSSTLRLPTSPAVFFRDSIDIIIVDPDVAKVNLTFDRSSMIFSEASGGGQVCVQVLGDMFTRSVPVMVSFEDGSAVGGVDFVNQPVTLQLSEANRTACVDVVVIRDGVYEDDEMFLMRLSTSDEASIIIQSTVNVTIQDSDNLTIGFTRSNYTVVEGDGTVQVFMEVLAGNLMAEVDVTVTPSSVTAIANSDFNGAAFVLSFSSAASRQVASVGIVEDSTVESLTPEVFRLAAMTDAPRVEVRPAMVDVFIQDDEVVTIQFEGGANVVEGSTSRICLNKSSVTVEDFTVFLSTMDGTAMNGTDYISSTLPASVLLPAGSTQSCFVVAVLDDQIALEPDSFFSIIIDRISPSSRRVVVPVSQVTVNIQDNDGLSISPREIEVEVREDAGIAEVCLEATPPEYLTSVLIQISYMSNTATAGADFDPSPTGVVLEASESASCFNVSITSDGSFEEDMENFTILLSTLDNRVTIDPAAVTIVIFDQDIVSFAWTNRSVAVSEDVGEVVLCAALTGRLSVPVTLDIFLDPITATANEDFQPPARPSMLTFQPGGGAVQCSRVNIIDDDVIESLTQPENIVVELMKTEPSNRVVFQPDQFTRIIISDNEEVVAGFGSDSVEVSEGDKEFTFCLNKTTQESLTFMFLVNSDTAVDGRDYISSVLPKEATLSGTLSGCQSSGEAIVDNSVALEPVRTFVMFINATSPQSDRITLSYRQLRVFIRDEDRVLVEFSAMETSVLETANVATVCINKNTEIATPLSVRVQTMDISATAGTDYVGGSFDVTFVPGGGNTECLNVTVLVDDVVENNEQFSLSLDVGGASSVGLGAVSNAIVTIVDPVPPITVNDTVTGDPVMTVPILVTDEQLASIGQGTDKSLSFCYEVHGINGTWFNMITDKCASINARYSSASQYLNIIDRIAVRAMDNSSTCVNIEVKVQNCSAAVDGVALPVMGRYYQGGVSVRRYSNRVRVSVPNCADTTLVMWMVCQEAHFPHDGVTANLVNLVVMRGLNYGRVAHGILGQFWNNPVSVVPYVAGSGDGPLSPDQSSDNLYTVTVTTSGISRSYVGQYRTITWEHREEPCLYVGDSQASSLGVNLTPNDGVLEGDYTDYIVDTAFSELGPFKFGLFDESSCT